MPIYLHGLALRNYRGIGPEWQMMSPMRDFNFFIGANNTGKSTVLNFISRWLPINSQKALGPAEAYQHGLKGPPEFAIGITPERLVNNVAGLISNNHHNKSEIRRYIEDIVEGLMFSSSIWTKYSILSNGNTEFLRNGNAPPDKTLLAHGEWSALWSALTNRGQGGIDQHWVPETLSVFKQSASSNTPRSILIPAIREIGPKGETFKDYGGMGLIDRLAEMQNPDIGQRQDRNLFNSINRFLQEVTGYDSAHIEIPYNRDHILVHINGTVLPLWALGTGIHEVILIASYCTINSEIIVCMEEPELHLHPLLQRKLLRYLKNNTNNQYFIATHSAAFIDTPGAAIFHVRHEDEQTRIRETILRSGRYEICQDLGYRASDIVQANAVVWCEGPSDRTYLNHWIHAVDCDLIEGIHYSIMFYGGRNLSHLSVNDNEVDEFISLKSLNRNSAVLIDSDRSTGADTINETKTRICDEFSKGSGYAWVTAGREIENYVPFATLQAAIASVHTLSYDKPANSGQQFDRAIQFRPKSEEDGKPRKVVTADKVKVAKAVCEKEAALDVLDLRERISALVEMIRSANA